MWLFLDDAMSAVLMTSSGNGLVYIEGWVDVVDSHISLELASFVL